jgi:non-heme chloroperoxidase
VAESLKLPARVWRAAFAGLLDMDVSAGLRRIEQPVLLLHGARNGLVPPEEQDWLLRTLPNARLLSFEGTGHAPHWEEPERFARELAAFAGAPAPSKSRRRPGGPSGFDLRRPGEGWGRGSLDSPNRDLAPPS